MNLLKERMDATKSFQEFKKIFKVPFKNEELLKKALLHRSYSNEKKIRINNENLEFLGDSVLNFIIVSYIYNEFPEKKEGDLAKIKSFVVSELALSNVSKKIGINKVIMIGKGEELSGGRDKKAILADCLEAIIGAYYLDSEFDNVRQFVLENFQDQIDAYLDDTHPKNYKTLLQELTQKKHKTCPKYTLKDTRGPDHKKTFSIDVYIGKKNYGSGVGSNKKDAEQEAAKVAYNCIMKNKKQK